jgi:hypothetical protein
MGLLVSRKTTAVTVAAKMIRTEPRGCRRHYPELPRKGMGPKAIEMMLTARTTMN